MCGYIGKYKELSNNEIVKILDAMPYGYLGSKNNEDIEVVPMYYALEKLGNQTYIYFILINEGQSFINMSYNGDMTLLVTNIREDCYESNFYSVVAKGIFELVKNNREISIIKQLFRYKYGCRNGYPLKSFEGNNINYVKMNITEMTGRKYTKNL